MSISQAPREKCTLLPSCELQGIDSLLLQEAVSFFPPKPVCRTMLELLDDKIGPLDVKVGYLGLFLAPFLRPQKLRQKVRLLGE